MTIKKLLFNLTVLILLSSFVILSSVTFFIHNRANRSSQLLADQLFDTAFDIYGNELAGSILIKNPDVVQALLDDLTTTRNLKAKLNSSDGVFYSKSDPGTNFNRKFQIINGNNELGTLSLSISDSPGSFNWLLDLAGPLALELVVIIFTGLIFWRLISKKMFNPLSIIVGSIHANDVANLKLPEDSLHELKDLGKVLVSMNLEIQSRAKAAAMAEIAAQVAHDIRSPLAALEVVSKDLAQLPEQSRIIIRHACNRIKDIATLLLQREKPSANSAKEEVCSVVLISSLLDTILTEKRMNFRQKSGIEIYSLLDASSYDLFSSVQATEFSRLVSNIINNAVESMNEKGRVEVALFSDPKSDRMILEFRDNGKGIPKSIIAQLGVRGATFGKESGSGLGLYHARSKVESWEGELKVNSTLGVGTTIRIELPKRPPPPWFVPVLEFSSTQRVVILDDDPSIHSVWSSRLLPYSDLEIVHLSNPTEFRKFVLDNPQSERRSLYLCDLELKGYLESGLDLIEEAKLMEQAILVTSRFEEQGLRDRCEQLRVRLIPKSLAAIVPIETRPNRDSNFSSQSEGSKMVLIDDDVLIHQIWKMAAKRANRVITCLTSYRDFKSRISEFPLTTQIYIDSSLGDGNRGEDHIPELKALGYKDIFLTTGYESTKFSNYPGLKVMGKDPPDWTATPPMAN
jgi:signal transduction histidine kinase